MFKLYTIWILVLFLVFNYGSVYSEDNITVTKKPLLKENILFQITDNITVINDNSTLNSDIDTVSKPSVSENLKIASYDLTYYNETHSGYKNIINKIAKGSDFLYSFVPDDYLKMYIPNNSNDPYTRYQITFFKDSSQSTDIPLSASNFLLDTIFEKLTDNLISFNLNSLDIAEGGFSIKIKPVSWLKIVLDTYDSKFTESKLKLEFNPTSNVALLFTRSDNLTEVKSGIEIQLYF